MVVTFYRINFTKVQERSSDQFSCIMNTNHYSLHEMGSPFFASLFTINTQGQTGHDKLQKYIALTSIACLHFYLEFRTHFVTLLFYYLLNETLYSIELFFEVHKNNVSDCPEKIVVGTAAIGVRTSYSMTRVCMVHESALQL